MSLVAEVLANRASWAIACCDVLDGLRSLPDGSVHCVVTSSPYWGLRDYGVSPSVWGGDPACSHEWGRLERGKRKDILPADETTLESRTGTDERQNGAATNGGRFCAKCDGWLGCLGLEPTPELFAAHLVLIFRELRRVLRADGTFFLNLGDTYCTKPMGQGSTHDPKHKGRNRRGNRPNCNRVNDPAALGLKHKDLVGVPWMVAFALRADGWWLRGETIWAKKNPMTESIRDRPTRAHEQVFLLTKRARYFYDYVAGAERSVSGRGNAGDRTPNHQPRGPSRRSRCGFTTNAPTQAGETRNARSVWFLASEPLKAAHFATMPTKLVRRCLKAGISEHGVCPACGSPWKRLVKKERTATRPGTNSKVNRASDKEDSPYQLHSGSVVGNRDPNRHCTRIITTGWAPTCSCEAGDPIPALVLDPFAGAGTVPMVARRMGARAIGFDLNAEYVAMAERRIIEDSPLMNAQPAAPAEKS